MNPTPDAVRQPAVAGSFYPSNPAHLRTAVERLLVREREPREVMALLAPHAGYVYSGATAGKVYAASVLRRRLFILCPNHTGLGDPISCMASGRWRTPLGEVPVDAPLAEALLSACPPCTASAPAHAREHAVEVQLPFLQVYLGEFSFVPIAVGTHDLLSLIALGKGLAKVLTAVPGEAAIVVSTDMNHYEDAETNRAKDKMALDAVLALDGRRLHQVCLRERITMCGFAPAVAAITAAVELGADRAELVDYTHSGQVTGDEGSVVSYAGVQIWKQ